MIKFFKKNFGNKITKIEKNKFFAGKVSLYTNSYTKEFITSEKFNEIKNLKNNINNNNIDEIEKLKLIKEYKSFPKIKIIKHMMCGYVYEDNTCLVTFFTSNNITNFNNIGAVENIQSIHNLKYLNPIWVTNIKEINEYFDISDNLNEFPKNFRDKSNNNTKILSKIFLDEYENILNHSIKNNLDPYSLELKFNNLELENNNTKILEYKKLESNILIASDFKILNKTHSNIFGNKTRLNIDVYSKIFENIEVVKGSDNIDIFSII